MKTKHIINFILLQLVWVGFIVGVSHDSVWIGLLIFMVMMGWQLHPDNRQDSDLVVIAVSVAAGAILASIWSVSDLVVYESHWPSADISPWWILLLWAGLGASFNHSLQWIQRNPYLAGTVFAFGGPVSYLAAERFGAVVINRPVLTLSLMAVGWFLVGFLLTVVVRRYKRSEKWRVADA